MDDLLQDITIYHKEDTQYVRYNKIASVRNTSYLNRNKTGVQTTDNAIFKSLVSRQSSISELSRGLL